MWLSIIVYQNMVCPHESSFLRSLAARPGVDVTWVVDTEVLDYRRDMGITRPDCGQTTVVITTQESDICRIVEDTGRDAIHIVAGPRGSTTSTLALPRCLQGGRRIGLLSEPGDPRGIKGLARRLLYRFEAATWGRRLDFVLAMGALGVDWFAHVGYPHTDLFPFCYVVDALNGVEVQSAHDDAFRIAYCGSLIHRKAVDVLLLALAEIRERDYRLSILGDGPLRDRYIALGQRLGIGDRITWHGVVPNEATMRRLQQSDLLVLPSRFDGWGAVVNEALTVGTPVICTDACGASDLLRNEWRGCVVPAGSVRHLSQALEARLTRGKVPTILRQQIAAWAACAISGDAVADYFLRILDHVYGDAPRPEAPWHNGRAGQ